MSEPIVAARPGIRRLHVSLLATIHVIILSQRDPGMVIVSVYLGAKCAF